MLAGEVAELRLRFRRGPGENGWHFPFPGLKPVEEGGIWDSFAAPINAAWSDVAAQGTGWVKEIDSPSFAELMAAVDTAEVRFVAEPAANSLLVGIDNYSLVPEPSGVSLLMIGGLCLVRIVSRGSDSTKSRSI